MPTPSSNLRPLALAIHLVAATAAGALSVNWAQASQAVAQPFDIPAGPLSNTLNRFAQQAGVAILFQSHNLGGLSSQGLHGRYPVEEGFAALLQGTGYEVGGVAVITGAASGIGRAAAAELCKQGVAAIALVDMADAVHEVAGQVFFLDQLQEGPLHIGVGNDEIGAHLIAIGEHDAGGAPAAREDFRDFRIGADGAAGGEERA